MRWRPTGQARQARQARQPIALTFDDGPGDCTGELLAALARFRARATFFVVGRHVVSHPATVSSVHAGGHELGNHSWDHTDLTGLGAQAVSQQLSLTDQAVLQVTGCRPTLVRPPFGAINDVVVEQAGRPVVLWTRDCQDWVRRDSDHVAESVIAGARPGDVVLLHEIPSTVRAVGRILAALTARGYTLVTVSQLLAVSGPTGQAPGWVRTRHPQDSRRRPVGSAASEGSAG